MTRLQAETATLRTSLGIRRASLAETLRAMQRLGANPPPAVFTAPDNALDAIRAASLLGHAMPALREEAEALSTDLRRLAALTSAQETEHATLVSRLSELSEERTRIELLVEEKRRSLRASETELAEARAKAEAMAGEAASVKDFIARMETEIAATRTAAEQAAAAERVARTAELERLALQNTARLEPAIPFTAARGLLPRPTSGVVTTDWGDEDGFGGRAEGLTMVTRAGAQVVSPTDGWVVYAGPYRSYGQLVILNAGEDHHVLLAGMDRIDVELGQFVLTGEPVAAMGGRLLASASVLAPQSTQPALYIEFRRNGQAIDPTPWWSDGEENQKVRG
ncbi:MAG: peptidoglycan DD-metalloendopeptidase family protein [Pseudomonadota bacterium]